jgi:dual oxidase
VGNKLQVHIKLEGTWTNQLRKLYDNLVARQGEQEDGVRIKAGCDGPFGAPAQRFHRFKRAIVIGTSKTFSNDRG